MNPPRPALRAIARRLIEERAAQMGAAGSAAEEVLRRVRERLVELVGLSGFEALLGRAVKLARVEAPRLERLQATPGGGLAGLADVTMGLDPAEAIEAPACLLAYLFELLATFIGADLTLGMARRVGRDDGSGERAAEDT